MDDGYFAFTAGTEYWGLDWFDEYDAKLGYLTSDPPTIPGRTACAA
jgi:hypothetical protein